MAYVSDEQRLIDTAAHMGPVRRRFFLKLATAAGAGIAAAPLLAACNRDGATGGAIESVRGAKLTSGTLTQQTPPLTNDYWNSWNRGYEVAVNALKCSANSYVNGSDPTKQLSQIETVASTGGKMLIGAPVSEAIIPAMGKRCQAAKIHWLHAWESAPWLTPVDVGDYVVGYVVPPSERAAYEVAKELFRQIGNEGQVVHIAGLKGASADYQRTAGLTRAAAETPGIEIVGGLDGGFDREKSRAVMLNLAGKYPGMKAVFAQSDAEANGVLSVLEERGMKDVKVSGVDGNAEALQKIAQGSNLVVTHLAVPPYLACYSAVTVFDAMNGWKPALPERMMFQGSTLVTRENAQEAYDKVYGSKFPYDVVKMSRTIHPDDWDPQEEMNPIDPNELWAGREKNGRELNTVYAGADFKRQFEEVKALYASHYKSGPFKK
ncbi:sugar ABC transporter substrate-binding protein [Amycolatopsis sp. CA-161197]|uniref:sugar ABC transporter substrate-binding protein n=1 Tax=Amycolatopsis sp. CA-161197 TaxID=3239922 RepID=UPI003D90B58F